MVRWTPATPPIPPPTIAPAAPSCTERANFAEPRLPMAQMMSATKTNATGQVYRA